MVPQKAKPMVMMMSRGQQKAKLTAQETSMEYPKEFPMETATLKACQKEPPKVIVTQMEH